MNKLYKILISEPWDVPDGLIVQITTENEDKILLKLENDFEYHNITYRYLIAIRHKTRDNDYAMYGVPSELENNPIEYDEKNWRGGLGIRGGLVELISS